MYEHKFVCLGEHLLLGLARRSMNQINILLLGNDMIIPRDIQDWGAAWVTEQQVYFKYIWTCMHATNFKYSPFCFKYQVELPKTNQPENFSNDHGNVNKQIYIGCYWFIQFIYCLGLCSEGYRYPGHE